MESIFDILELLIKLPYHIYHIVTFGKFAKKESEKMAYHGVAVLIIMFIILYIIIRFLMHIT